MKFVLIQHPTEPQYKRIALIASSILKYILHTYAQTSQVTKAVWEVHENLY